MTEPWERWTEPKTIGECACGNPLEDLGGRGTKPTRCLLCSRIAGGNWKRSVQRCESRYGAQKAAEYAERQGVPHVHVNTGVLGGANNGLLKQNEAVRRPRRQTVSVQDPDLLKLAAYLQFAPNLQEAARLAGLKHETAQLEKIAREAKKVYRNVYEGSASELAKLSYTVMVAGLARVLQDLDQMTPGAVAQLTKALYAVWSELGGAAGLAGLTIDFGAIDEDEEDETPPKGRNGKAKKGSVRVAH